MNEDIKEIYKEMYKAMIEKNEKKLNELHDDSFVLVHMTGMCQSKSEYISSIMNGTLNYFSVAHDDISVTVNGDTAVLMGKSNVEAAVFGGSRNIWRLRLDMKLVNKNGIWLFTEARASAY